MKPNVGFLRRLGSSSLCTELKFSSSLSLSELNVDVKVVQAGEEASKVSFSVQILFS